ncbi:unnamed protein product [Leuciscus chuanchicus]
MIEDGIAGSSRTLSSMAQKVRAICKESMKLYARRKGQMIGQPREFVMIDESNFRHKRVTFRSLSFQYRIGRSTINEMVMETCQAVNGVLKDEHLKTLTTKMESTYYNYKSRFSVVHMAVVDADYKLMYANVGVQGRVSDGGIFDQLDFRATMNRDQLNVPTPEPLPGSNITLPYVFAGDEAFHLRINLMKPYSFQNLDHGQ